jgi:hypothetical protein
MGLNLSNEQIGQELALNGSDVQQMTAQLRAGIGKKSPQCRSPMRWSAMKPMSLLVIKDSQKWSS